MFNKLKGPGKNFILNKFAVFSFVTLKIIVFAVSIVVITGCEAERTASKSSNSISVTPTSVNNSTMSTMAKVTRVIDGDTVDVRFQNGETDRVRLLTVDTPEIRSANKPNKFKDITDIECLHNWGIKAYEMAKYTLEGEEVSLIFDEQAGRRGYYDRLLAYIEINGEDFNELLIEGGYARVYEEGKSSREKTYLLTQDRGIELGKGLWGECSSK